jgi:hypothetical protein
MDVYSIFAFFQVPVDEETILGYYLFVLKIYPPDFVKTRIIEYLILLFIYY